MIKLNENMKTKYNRETSKLNYAWLVEERGTHKLFKLKML